MTLNEGDEIQVLFPGAGGLVAVYGTVKQIQGNRLLVLHRRATHPCWMSNWQTKWKKGELIKGPSSIHTIQVIGSKGNLYDVTIKNGKPISCSCPGYKFHGKCRHMKQAGSPADRPDVRS